MPGDFDLDISSSTAPLQHPLRMTYYCTKGEGEWTAAVEYQSRIPRFFVVHLGDSMTDTPRSIICCVYVVLCCVVLCCVVLCCVVLCCVVL